MNKTVDLCKKIMSLSITMNKSYDLIKIKCRMCDQKTIKMNPNMDDIEHLVDCPYLTAKGILNESKQIKGLSKKIRDPRARRIR